MHFLVSPVDLGLADDGSLELDYGARKLTVRLDEELTPFVMDSSGRRIESLPKPNKADDPEKVKSATDRFKVLKREAKAFATTEVAKLEAAMCSQKAWSASDFRVSFVDHPLLVPLARRLVWSARGATFRIEEDRTFVTADDAPFALSDDATVVLVHRLDVDDATAAAWTAHFDRYEHVQPFEQLDRRVFTIAEKERTATELTRLRGAKATTREVLSLEALGWRRESRVFLSRYTARSSDLPTEFSTDQREGWLWSWAKEQGGYDFRMQLLSVYDGNRKETPAEYLFSTVYFARAPGNDEPTFDALPPVMFSELVRQLSVVVH